MIQTKITISQNFIQGKVFFFWSQMLSIGREVNSIVMLLLLGKIRKRKYSLY